MSGKAAKIQCTEKQLAILKKLAAARKASQRIVQRTRIILIGNEKEFNRDIAAQVGLCLDQVGVWRRSWNESLEALIAIECRESTAALTRAIEQVLSDAPRSGSPGTFTAEQVTQILATACEPPENTARPIDNWTHRENEVITRQFVSSISVRHHGEAIVIEGKSYRTNDDSDS